MAQSPDLVAPPPPPRKRRRDDTAHHPAKHKRPTTCPSDDNLKEQVQITPPPPPSALPMRCHVCSRAQSVGFGTITVCGACKRGTCYVCTRRCDACAETVCSGCCEERGVQCFCGRCGMGV